MEQALQQLAKTIEQNARSAFSADDYKLQFKTRGEELSADLSQRFSYFNVGYNADLDQLMKTRENLETNLMQDRLVKMKPDDVQDYLDDVRKEYNTKFHREVDNFIKTQTRYRTGEVTQERIDNVREKDFELSKKMLDKFNEKMYGDNAHYSPFPTKNADGELLSDSQIRASVEKFQNQVLHDLDWMKEAKDDVLKNLATRQWDMDNIEDERYVMLKQQFNNPELIQRMSPESYDIIMALKEDKTMTDDEKLKRYFEICDTNAVEQGVLSLEEAKFYNTNASQLGMEKELYEHNMQAMGISDNVTPAQMLQQLINGRTPPNEQFQTAQMQNAEQVVQDIKAGQGPELSKEQQNQINKALDHQMNGGAEMEAAAEKFTNAPDMTPAPSNSANLRNQHINQMSPKPKR